MSKERRPSPWLAVLVLWSLAWKGAALWRAARRGQLGWFVTMAVVNTAGLLEMVYLFLVAPRRGPALPRRWR